MRNIRYLLYYCIVCPVHYFNRIVKYSGVNIHWIYSLSHGIKQTTVCVKTMHASLWFLVISCKLLWIKVAGGSGNNCTVLWILIFLNQWGLIYYLIYVRICMVFCKQKFKSIKTNMWFVQDLFEQVKITRSTLYCDLNLVQSQRSFKNPHGKGKF